MKNTFRSVLLSAVVLIAGFAASCTDPEPNGGHYEGTPTISVTPASVTVPLAGGTTEAVTVTTPAEWTLTIDTEGVVASATSGNGDGVVTFDVPAADAMRTIKVTFTATGYVSGFPITKKASISISQSDTEIPSVDGAFVYSDNCGSAVSKVDGYWPSVDKYEGWAPTGGEGFDQSGVTYTGKNASVRNSGKTWAPVGATYATDAPYAYLQAKNDSEFVINNINITSGVKNYTFSFTAFNQYASLIASPYTPVVTPLESGKNLTVEVSVDGQNWGAVAFTTMPDGNWTYAIAPFTLPADADKLFVRFSGYKADTTTPLPSTEYQYQAALRFDDFRLVEGGEGPVVDFNNAAGGGGNTEPSEAVVATVEQFLAAAEDDTLYELTGVISNVTNTTYGNFDLTDATGTVLIYGLCGPNGEQKYWAASGAKAGDTITVRTVRSSYNGTAQGKNAIFVSLVPGEGGDEPTPEPAEGIYASDVAFVCAADDSTNAAYSLGDTTIDGSAATGFKLGKSKQQGKFTSKAVGVAGTKYINLYAAAWKSTTATLYFRVDGGAVQSIELAGNTGATGNPPYPITFAATDHYSVKLEGLTEASTIEFGTNADFALTTHGGQAPDIAPRVIVCGVKLTDEPLGTDNPGGGEQPDPTPDPEPTADPTPDPTPGEYTTVAQFLAAAEDNTIYTLKGTITSVANTQYGNFDLTDETGTVYIYGLVGPNGESQYWNASGAKLGDDIVVKTVRTSYNNSPQGKNATFVEVTTPGTVAFWNFSKTSVSFAAAASEQVVNIDAYNLKSDISVAVDNNHFTASYANGKLTIVAAENTAAEAVTGNVTVTSGSLSQVVALSQLGASSGGKTLLEGTVSFANTAQRTAYSTDQQIWENDGIKITNNQASSTSNVGDYSNPARFYKSSEVIIEAVGEIDTIVVDCSGFDAKYATPWGTVENGKVTIKLDGTSKTYTITSLSAQARANSITVTYLK